MKRRRRLRRQAGMLKARLPELQLRRVKDPRRFVGKWPLERLLRGALLGLMAGAKSLAEVEELTESFTATVRRELGVSGRVPDTTLRDVMCRLDPSDLRACLHRAVKAAHRRKALSKVELPFHVAALDGKATSLPSWDGPFAQRHQHEHGLPFGLMRTVTAALVTAPGRPCIDAIPIPAKTNEMGGFQEAFGELVAAYGDLFEVITYDAGVSSEHNGRVVVEGGKNYVFRLRHESRYMYRMAEELIDPADVAAQTEDVLDNHTTLIRKLSIVAVERHWSWGRNKWGKVEPDASIWEHTKTFLRVESEKWRDGKLVEREARLYNSSLVHDALTPEQWLYLLRAHWGVENNNHHTLDVAFEEDDRPWIKNDPHGMLAVLLLRRIAYTLLTLFRSVTQRSEEARAIPWKRLMRWVSRTLVALQPPDVEGLRSRKLLHALD